MKSVKKEIHKKILALILSLIIFTPKSHAHSATADLAPIVASVIFFTVAAIVAIKSSKKKKDKPTQETIITAPSEEKNDASLYDPDPILKSEPSNP
jgi:Skp family chaperone for outer membrane proteins